VKPSRWMCVLFAGLIAPALLCGCGSVADPTAVVPDDSAPPTAPSGVRSASDSDGRLALAWDPSPSANVVGYETYRFAPDPSRDSAWLQVADADETDALCTLPTAPSGTMVYYRVRAIDSKQRAGAFSTPLNVYHSSPAWSGGGPPGTPIGSDESPEKNTDLP
jgi:hypothetical protein